MAGMQTEPCGANAADDAKRQEPRFGRLPSLIIAVTVIGMLIGVAAGLLTLMLYVVEHAFLGYVEGDGQPGPFDVPAWRRAISVFVGLSIAAFAWWLLRTRTARVPSVKKAVNGERMPLWQTVVHVLLQIFIVGTGASIGREVAPRELGALFGQRFAHWIHLGPRDTRTLVAITAAAGLAGVYNAPLAGTFFATEILLADISVEAVSLAFGCSALASWMASLVKGTHVFYAIGHVDGLFTSDLIGFAVVAGLVCGLFGSLFRRGSSWAESHRSSGRAILWTLPLAGVLTGVGVRMVGGRGAAAFVRGQGGGDVAYHSCRCVGWRIAAGHRIGCVDGCVDGRVLDDGVSYQFDGCVCVDRRVRAARRIAEGAVDGHVPGDGAGRCAVEPVRSRRVRRGRGRLGKLRAVA